MLDHSHHVHHFGKSKKDQAGGCRRPLTALQPERELEPDRAGKVQAGCLGGNCKHKRLDTAAAARTTVLQLAACATVLAAPLATVKENSPTQPSLVAR